MYFVFIVTLFLCFNPTESSILSCGSCPIGKGMTSKGFFVGADTDLGADCMPLGERKTEISLKLPPNVSSLLNLISNETWQGISCEGLEREEHVTAFIVDGVFQTSLHSSIFQKANPDETDTSKAYTSDQFCCSRTLLDDFKCNGDSLFQRWEPQKFSNELNHCYCWFTGFQMVGFTSSLWSFEAMVTYCDVDIINKLNIEETGEGFKIDSTQDVTIRIDCENFSKMTTLHKFQTLFKVPKIILARQSNCKITFMSEANQQTFNLTSLSHNHCHYINCVLCWEYILNPECSNFLKTLLLTILAIKLIYITMRLLKVTFHFIKNRQRLSNKFKTIVRVVKSAEEEDELTSETIPLREVNNRPRQRFQKVLACILILCLSNIEACDKSYYTKNICVGLDCVDSFSISTFGGQTTCFNLEKNEETISITPKSIRMIPHYQTLYLTAAFKHEISTTFNCWTVGACSAMWCEYGTRSSEYNYVTGSKTKDLQTSRCVKTSDPPFFCFFGKGCLWYTISLDRQGPFWLVEELKGFDQHIDVEFGHGNETLIETIPVDQLHKVSFKTTQFDIIIHKNWEDIKLPSYRIVNTKTQSIRLVSKVSPPGLPNEKLIGSVQCKNNTIFSYENCVMDHQMFHEDVVGGAVRTDLEEVNLEKASLTLPLQWSSGVTILQVKSENHAVSSLVPEFNAKVELTYKVKPKIDIKSCALKFVGVEGCFNCQEGAVLLVESDSEATVKLTSSIHQLNFYRKVHRGKNEFRFSYDKKAIYSKLHWSCGSTTGSFVIKGILQFEAVDLDKIDLHQEVSLPQNLDDSTDYFSWLSHLDLLNYLKLAGFALITIIVLDIFFKILL